MSEANPLQATVRRRDGTAIIDIQGEIDGFADKALHRAYAEAAAGQPQQILLNFSGVESINSTGIAVLVAVLAQARRDQLPLLSYGLNDHYQEIFRITRLSEFIRAFRDEEAALQG